MIHRFLLFQSPRPNTKGHNVTFAEEVTVITDELENMPTSDHGDTEETAEERDKILIAELILDQLLWDILNLQ